MAQMSYIALLKGVNVGGNNLLPMTELRMIAESLNWDNVQTYIQSGNLVFTSKNSDTAYMQTALINAIMAAKGFAPHTRIISDKQLDDMINANPFDVPLDAGNKLHLMVSLDHNLTIDMTAVDAVRIDSEKFEIVNDVAYLYAPDGVGRSKLSAKLPKLLSQDVTARNYKTILNLQALSEQI